MRIGEFTIIDDKTFIWEVQMISHLGRYEIIEELGRGEVGVVYKARDPLIERLVAIKAIDLRGLNKEEREEYETRFYQEAKAAGRLNHPNIITIHDLGRSDDVAYIAMELMEGPELRNIVAGNQPLSLDEKLDIAFQVAIGLAYANEHGVVHRDIKPSNILVLRGKHVKIADFGIARINSSLWRTRTGKVVGTPLYMSPEQVLSHSIDARSDIFSFGIVLYQMLTDQLPFNGDNPHSIMYQIVNEYPQNPSLLNPEISQSLNRIVSRCLEKKPEDRYQNANELAEDLHLCRGKLPLAHAGIDPPKSPSGRDDKTHGMKIGWWKLIGMVSFVTLLSGDIVKLIGQIYSVA